MTSSTSSPPPRLAPRWPWLLVALAFAAAQFVYARHLNALYYSLHAPFYDSMAYYEQGYHTWESTRADGLLEGLSRSLRGTTALPFILIPPLAWLLEPSRALAIAYQSLWVVALYFAAALFLRRLPGASRGMCALLPLLFTAGSGFWFFNGGISDFRMDLLFYLGFGLSVIAFLSARELGRPRDWLLFGVICGLVCLGRATAPVFLVLTFAPMLLLSWWAGRLDARGVGRAILWATPACIAVCGWFYVLNLKHLYFYYFFWNSDANAGLPWRQSVQHFRHAFAMLGAPLALAGLVLVALGLTLRDFPARVRAALAAPRRLDWALIFPALVPAGFLTLKGAGLNPFVALPSAFGFALLLIFASRAWAFTGWRAAVAAVALSGGAAWAAFSGVAAHVSAPGESNRIAGYERAWALLQQAGTRFPQRTIISTPVSMAFYTHDALLNWQSFDARLPRSQGAVEVNGRRYPLRGDLVRLSIAANGIDWTPLPGATLEEKESALADRLAREADILFLPDEAAATLLARDYPHNFINTRLPTLRNRILESGDWEPMPEGFSVSPWEAYGVWINRARLAVGESRASHRAASVAR